MKGSAVPLRHSSGTPLPEAEKKRRHKIVHAFLAHNPEATRGEVADAVGLTPKQVDTAKRYIPRRSIFYYGRCAGQPETCGPCAECVGICPKCTLPIRDFQSRTKIVMTKCGITRQVYIHLACKE